jgi:uncharacterized protein
MTASGALLGAAVGAGLVGSLHCSLMCGPLAIAGCTEGGRFSWKQAAGYLGGRLGAYAAIGAALGAVGEHALCRLPVPTAQIVVLALVAAFAAWRAFQALRGKPTTSLLGRRSRGGGPLHTLAARVAGLARSAGGQRRGLVLGLATGLLPCGMLLPAWTLAMGAGSAASGAAVMAAFWGATLPGLLAPLLGRRAVAGLAARIPGWAQGLAWGALAAWIALRPLLAAAHHH